MTTMPPAQLLDSIRDRLLMHAWDDAVFRQLLLENPRAAIEQATGVTFPPEVTLNVVSEDATTLYLVLPPPSNMVGEDGELSDEALETAAGGGANRSSLLNRTVPKRRPLPITRSVKCAP